MWKYFLIIFLLSGCSSAASAPETAFENETEVDEAASQQGHVIVDLKGAVMKPGVYKLAHDARIYELINMAGGITNDACLSTVNQAAFVRDAEIIYIPHWQEDNTETYENDTRIDINAAPEDQLVNLPDIGPATAQNIIAYRQESGRFTSIDDIMNVRGIGEATFDTIKGLIRV